MADVLMRQALSRRERDILWLVSQGYRSGYIAREHAMDEGSVKNKYVHISERLGTRSLPHSVAVGLLTGVIGQYRDCGERRAYLRHLRRSETPCMACRHSNAVYVRGQRQAPSPADAGLTATQIRVLKCLHDHDCSQVEAAERLGLTRKSVASHMTGVYRRLGVAHLHRMDRREAAIKTALDRGYLD